MSKCHKCGCEVESPFDGTTIMHDVERCNGMKFTRKFQYRVDFQSGEIQLETMDAERAIMREVIKTKDKAIRSALITLGWTPPPESDTLTQPQKP